MMLKLATGALAVLSYLLVNEVEIRHAAPLDCSPQGLLSRLSKCYSLNIGSSHIGGLNETKNLITHMCDSVECSIACYTNAIGQCTSTGLARVVDLNANKVSTRYACSDPKGILDSITNCGWYLFTDCLGDLIQSMASAGAQLATPTPDFNNYFTSYCSAAKRFKTCTPRMEIPANDTCTRAQANRLNILYNITSSIQACGIKQDSPQFTTYGGPAGACGQKVVG